MNRNHGLTIPANMDRLPPDIPEFLATVAPFSLLDRAAIERFARALEVRYCREGQTIARFTSPWQDGLYVVRKGAVELADPEDRVLEKRGEGELFGHRIQFHGEVGDYRARAAEDCLLWHLDQARTEQLLASQPRLNEFFANHGERLRASVRGGGESIADLPLRQAITTSPECAVADCARRMAENQVSCLPVVDESGLVGIVTDRDLRNRVLARRLDPDTPARAIMTPDPATIAITDRAEQALVEMMRLGIHHLPVVADDGRLSGVISSGDLLRVQAPHPLRLVRDLTRAESREAVIELARKGPRMLAGLARSGSGASEVGRIAGRITDACTRRLLGLAVEALERETGPAPMPWAWLAFGSQARLEQGLISDQDNGLALAQDPDPAAAAWFERLAQRVCDDLHACGYVHCPGGVMAMGEWRMSVTAWRRRFERWIREPEPDSVMRSSIFFDLRVVAGDRGIVDGLHRDVLARARDSQIFRRFLAANSIAHRPPVGLFRRFVQERGGAHSHGLDLKKRGVIPIVDLARVRALEGAIEAVHTEERLEAAAAAGDLSASDADDLIHALRFVGDIRLAHQARQLEQGLKPDHLVDPDELSNLHRRYLRSAFGIVSDAQSALAQRYLL